MNIDEQIKAMMRIGRGPNLTPPPPPPPFVLPADCPRIDAALDTGFPPENDIDQKTRTWLRSHPEAVALIDKTVRNYITHKRRFGFKMIVEVLRWHYEFTYDDDFKWPNEHTAYVASIWCWFYPPVRNLVIIKKRRASNTQVTP